MQITKIFLKQNFFNEYKATCGTTALGMVVVVRFAVVLGYQQESEGGSSEPTPVPGTIQITNIGPEATVEKLGELFGSLGKIKV